MISFEYILISFNITRANNGFTDAWNSARSDPSVPPLTRPWYALIYFRDLSRFPWGNRIWLPVRERHITFGIVLGLIHTPSHSLHIIQQRMCITWLQLGCCIRRLAMVACWKSSLLKLTCSHVLVMSWHLSSLSRGIQFGREFQADHCTGTILYLVSACYIAATYDTRAVNSMSWTSDDQLSSGSASRKLSSRLICKTLQLKVSESVWSCVGWCWMCVESYWQVWFGTVWYSPKTWILLTGFAGFVCESECRQNRSRCR